MSGGYFDHAQFRLWEIAESIRSTIVNNSSTEKDEWGQEIGRHYPSDIIAKFAETADVVERAEKMVTRVDWLLSGDDGEDAFRRRWREQGLDQPSPKQKGNENPMTKDEAIGIVAATLLYTLDLPDWKQYPDIGLEDWQEVIQCCESMLARISEHYTAEDFRQAYDALSSKSEGEAE